MPLLSVLLLLYLLSVVIIVFYGFFFDSEPNKGVALLVAFGWPLIAVGAVLGLISALVWVGITVIWENI
jgi:hypothetical protein